jgi:menaquinone-9 beta-reductase
MIEEIQSRSYDVVVVGARCAGAAVALLLARQGVRVLVVERARYGADTLSTHALMRGGVLQLHRWGILGELKAAGTPTVRSTSFHYGDEVVEIPIKPKDGIDGLYAPRRNVIDPLLADAARSAGAEVVYEARLVDLLRRDNRVRGVRLRGADGRDFEVGSELVIGADGVRSTVAPLVGAKTYKAGRHATGVIFNYWADTGITGYHWCYRPGVSVGVIPTNDGLACVFVSVSQSRFRDEVGIDVGAAYPRLLNECNPALAAVVDRATRAEKYRGFAGEVGFFRQSYGPGWALVGDAGYFKDPLTAHGMTDALIDAELLARSVVKGSESALGEYQSARDELAMQLFDVTDAIASYDWDLIKVAELHRSLSDEMKKETAAVMSWIQDAPPND